MMQKYHGVLRRPGQRAVEPREFILSQAAADMPGVVAVEHDELPIIRLVCAANLKTARR